MQHEHETDAQGRQTCTTSGEAPSKVRAAQTEIVGQHGSYVVLCEEERAKGFTRPYRDSYRHVGRPACGKIVDQSERLGGTRKVCLEPPDHPGGCDGVFQVMDQPQHAEVLRRHAVGGCGTVTTMGRSLSETYARDPKFYGSTFCVGCNVHLPVAEFTWVADGERVGS